MQATHTTTDVLDWTIARLYDHYGPADLRYVGLDGWMIEQDRGAPELGLPGGRLTLCSPGTCARELDYRDESEQTLRSLLPEWILDEIREDAEAEDTRLEQESLRRGL